MSSGFGRRALHHKEEEDAERVVNAMSLDTTKNQSLGSTDSKEVLVAIRKHEMAQRNATTTSLGEGNQYKDLLAEAVENRKILKKDRLAKELRNIKGGVLDDESEKVATENMAARKAARKEQIKRTNINISRRPKKITSPAPFGTPPPRPQESKALYFDTIFWNPYLGTANFEGSFRRNFVMTRLPWIQGARDHLKPGERVPPGHIRQVDLSLSWLYSALMVMARLGIHVTRITANSWTIAMEVL